MIKRQQWLEIFVLVYLAIAIALLTLNPFIFQPYTPAEFWVWRFSVEDFSRNILLFFPLGFALKHSFCNRLITVLFYGFLLSFSVEVTQLFIELRSSNVVDLISNSSGALAGGLFYGWAVNKYSRNNISAVPLACLFVPICWISAIRLLWTPLSGVTVFLSAIASLTLIQSHPTTQPKKTIVAIIWLSLCYLPALNTNLLIGCLLIVATPAVISFAMRIQPQQMSKVVVRLSAIALLNILVLNGIWYFTSNAPGWTNNEHLRLSESILSTATLLTCLFWQHRSKAKLSA